MDTFCIHDARKMRTNFSLVYITPCTFKCLIKITRQSSNSYDAGIVTAVLMKPRTVSVVSSAQR